MDLSATTAESPSDVSLEVALSVPRAPPWDNDELLRAELFSIERLEQHAASLAVAQQVAASPPRRPALGVRLSENEAALLGAYRAIAKAVGEGRAITPAAEWLLGNYHLVEAQIREIREDLPPGFYRRLPKLATGPLVGYPRVFGIAWAFVAHTDSHFDPDSLLRFVRACQAVQPLTIGELWAVAITVRIALVENLRRAADVYSVATHVGRGGWTWYTGSAGWIYRAGLEWILGFRVQGSSLRVDPCIPAHWPGFEIAFRHHDATYTIVVENPEHVSRGVSYVELDGLRLPGCPTTISLVDDGAAHFLRLVLGRQPG